MAIELNKSSRSVSRESKVYEIGRDVVAAKKQNKGPDIWLAGDPADLERWMPFGIAGVVTNGIFAIRPADLVLVGQSNGTIRLEK